MDTRQIGSQHGKAVREQATKTAISVRENTKVSAQLAAMYLRAAANYVYGFCNGLFVTQSVR